MQKELKDQVRKENSWKAFIRECDNREIVANGKLTIERDDDSWTTYGFEDLILWNGKTHISLGSNDKFKVTAEDYETAKSEFWQRWSIFIKRALKLDYVKIEATNL